MDKPYLFLLATISTGKVLVRMDPSTREVLAKSAIAGAQLDASLGADVDGLLAQHAGAETTLRVSQLVGANGNVARVVTLAGVALNGTTYYRARLLEVSATDVIELSGLVDSITYRIAKSAIVATPDGALVALRRVDASTGITYPDPAVITLSADGSTRVSTPAAGGNAAFGDTSALVTTGEGERLVAMEYIDTRAL